MDALTLSEYQGVGERYLTCSNGDGKQWSIPYRYMRAGMEIYEPSGWKGRMLKKFLPFLKERIPFKPLQAAVTSIELHSGLKRLLEQQFGTGWQCSVFWGTPCIDRKITMQIYREDKILGYCKVGSSDRVIRLFLHEKAILERLEREQVRHVPRCLAVQPVVGQTWAFLQTTEKIAGSRTEHGYGSSQEEFLHELYEKTKEKVLFEQTDYYDSLCFLRQHLPQLSLKYRDSVSIYLSRVWMTYHNQTVEWGMCHGDFTPWNTCMTDGGVFAFDFEYALSHAPAGFDRWHFFVQTKIFEKKWDGRRIVKAYQKLPEHESAKGQFVCYLLGIISLYLQRGQKEDLATAEQRAKLLYLFWREKHAET